MTARDSTIYLLTSRRGSTGSKTVEDWDANRAVDNILGYFERYRPARTAAARELATAQIKQWYHGIRDHSLNGAHLDRNEEMKQYEITGHRN